MKTHEQNKQTKQNKHTNKLTTQQQQQLNTKIQHTITQTTK